jgi:hypothetical protein
VYEWRNFTTLEDLKQNGLYAGNGMYYAAGNFGPNILETRQGTLYSRTGICTHTYRNAVYIVTGCKYLVDDGNFELIASQDGKVEKGVVTFGTFGVGRVFDDQNVINVGLILFNCNGGSAYGCFNWGNYIGEIYPANKAYEALIYKPLAI